MEADAPVDHLTYRWLRGKYAGGRAYFGARRIIAFRHTLFWHVGDASVGARELDAAIGGEGGDERRGRRRVRGDGLAVGSEHRLAVAVVGQDEEP